MERKPSRRQRGRTTVPATRLPSPPSKKAVCHRARSEGFWPAGVEEWKRGKVGVGGPASFSARGSGGPVLSALAWSSRARRQLTVDAGRVRPRRRPMPTGVEVRGGGRPGGGRWGRAEARRLASERPRRILAGARVASAVLLASSEARRRRRSDLVGPSAAPRAAREVRSSPLFGPRRRPVPPPFTHTHVRTHVPSLTPPAVRAESRLLSRPLAATSRGRQGLLKGAVGARGVTGSGT